MRSCSAWGIEVCETTCEGHKWKQGRRMVLLRQRVSVRPRATGKALRLFAGGYRYGCFVTNMGLPPAEVWRLYRGRADAENRIKKLKADFAVGGFNMRGFDATEAAMNFAMIGYNLMSLFRQVVVCRATQPTLKTLRYKVFAVGGYVVKQGNGLVLRLSMAMKRREWFKGLWAKSDAANLPANLQSYP